MKPRPLLSAGLLLLGLATLAEAAPPRRVLVLQSFGRGIEPYSIFSATFRTELSEIFPESIEYHELSLDAMLSDEPDGDDPLIVYLSTLATRRPLDLVVTVGGPAAVFVQRNRARLFPRTPLLIACVDNRHLEGLPLTANDAVAPVAIDLRAPFDSLLRLRPQTSTVIVILGASPLAQFWKEAFERELEPLAGRLRLEFVDDLSFAEVLERAAAPPDDAAIFYGLFAVDADGVPYEHEVALPEIRAVAGAPVFGLFVHQLGRGIVGGPLLSVEQSGQRAADAARRILDGESPASIRGPAVRPDVVLFDGRELERWHIDRGRLPPGSEIRFQQAGLWRYRWQILGVSALCAAEALLIVLLIANRSRRRHAEIRLRESREQYALALEGSTDGLWDWQVSSGEVFLSSRGRDILGYGDRETVSDVASWDGRVHADDRNRVSSSLTEHLAGRAEALRVSFRLSGNDGDPRFILVRGKAQRDAGGHALRVTGSMTDVTEQRLAEQAVRDLNRRLITVQEQERARLARELHDDLSQRLARLAIDAGRTGAATTDPAAAGAMREIGDGLARLGEDTHAVAYRLHPAVLEDLGLPEALRIECERFSRHHRLPAQLDLSEVPPGIPRDVSICLFRVVQEALRNVGRHARASRTELTLRGLDGGLQLAVRDDGVGFDPARARGHPSLGHASMRERVHSVGGEIDVDSAPGEGTTIAVWVPLREQGP